jgi:glycosyltransferase involved in cell wall biosynthesis
LACVVADAMVTDAEVIRRHYEERYGAASVPIAYGVEPRPLAADAAVDEGRSVLARLGVEPRRYLLYVSRFEAENNPHRVVEAYGQVGGDMPLVMVGSAPYAGRFIADIRATADDRVLFPGAIYGDGYRQLLSHAFAYVQATEVGGTHPALVEAMGYGNALLVNEAPENREVAGDDALYFRAAEPATLAAAIETLLAAPREEVERRRAAAAARAERLYSWPRVVDCYEALFRRLVASRRDLK